MKYVVDTCIINKLIDGKIDPANLPNNGDFIASHIQIDELNNTKDVERRAKLFLKFTKVIHEVVPTESFVLGISRFSESKFDDVNMYTSIKTNLDSLNNGKKNNPMDALIAEIAIKNKYTLLTTDKDLKEVVERLSGKVRYWQP